MEPTERPSRNCLPFVFRAAAAVLLTASATGFRGPVYAQEQPEVLSVLDFADNGGSPDWAWLSAGLSDMLITDLAAAGVSVVDRGDTEAALEEQSMALAGLTAEDAVQIGRLVSADALLTGSFTVVRETLRMDARIVDVGTGEVIGTATVAGSSESVFGLERQLAGEVCLALGVDPPTATAGGGENGAGTASVPAARAYYEGLIFQSSGDVETARARFEEAADLDPLYARPRYSLEESWQLLKDFRRLRQQREVNVLWTKAEALKRRLAADPFVTDADAIMAAYTAGSPAVKTGSPQAEDPTLGSCPTPAVCLWNLQITYWEIGTKSAEYFDDGATEQAALREIVSLARRADDEWPNDEWLPEILYWEVFAHRWLGNWAEAAAGCERLFVDWPDFRMAWALEDIYETALGHLGE